MTYLSPKNDVSLSLKDALNVIRGWNESTDPRLDKTHALPSLGTLVAGDKRIEIHGTEVYLGRFHPQQGPVDVLFTNFEDHEIYKFAAPHIRLILERKQWFLRSKAPNCWTSINGEEVASTRTRTAISSGDVIKIGCVDFVFESHVEEFDSWLEQKKSIFRSETQTSLFLKRDGGVCGPRYVLGDLKTAVVGRAFDPEYSRRFNLAQPDWDLGSLKDSERKFIAFRHISFFRDGPDWTVNVLTNRQKVYVNRREITDSILLMPGDEIALGNVIFHFHDPSNFEASTTRKTSDLPAAIDWAEESRANIDAISIEPTEMVEDD